MGYIVYDTQSWGFINNNRLYSMVGKLTERVVEQEYLIWPIHHPSVMPSTSPSGEPRLMPLSVPSTNPSVDPSDTPSVEPSRLPPIDIHPCIICTDVEPPWLKLKCRDCRGTKGLMKRKCNLSRHWIENQYCQQSCFDEGNAYDICECCDLASERPSTFPSNKPSLGHPSSVPSKVQAPSPILMRSTLPSGEPSLMPSSVPRTNPLGRFLHGSMHVGE